MTTPSSNERPQVGDVIAFRYVWSYEKQKRGRYPRPCLVVHVEESGTVVKVMVVPISSKKPAAGTGIELSATALKILGLTKPSLIVATEANETSWPGYYLEPVPPGVVPAGPDWRYGRVGPVMLDAVAAIIDAQDLAGLFPVTDRN